jgi:hypothetical protein
MREDEHPRTQVYPDNMLTDMIHHALLQCRTNVDGACTERPVPSKLFDGPMTPDRPSDRPSTLFYDARPQHAYAYICALTPACPSPCISTKCCFCALVARHILDHHSEYGNLSPAFATCRQAGRRETGKQAVGTTSFIHQR